MKHIKAKEWDLKRYPELEGKTPKGLIPFNRPCDWCGQPVDIGFIHKDRCRSEERSFWLDVFN